MISKKISDLKDIKFEITTALQFEPSHRLYFVHDFLKGLCKMNNFQYIDCLSFFLKKGTMVCSSLR